jgi:anti-anti-sigma factor
MRTHYIEGITVLVPEGRIDSAHSLMFIDDVTKAIAKQNAKVIVDFSEVTFLSSSGLRALLVGVKLAFGGRTFAICGPNPLVFNIMKTAGFDKIVKIYQTRDDAVRGVK